jgi:hypothetical protein
MTMAEYIEREKALNLISDIFFATDPNGEEQCSVIKCSRAIRNAPSADVVEVVRCKDCKHFCPYEGEEHKGDCAELVGLESCVYEDDFCSYGERRSEDENQSNTNQK